MDPVLIGTVVVLVLLLVTALATVGARSRRTGGPARWSRTAEPSAAWSSGAWSGDGGSSCGGGGDGGGGGGGC